ncbi:MAG: ABC transporter ATP-binding protein [Planctomycetota bacterium]
MQTYHQEDDIVDKQYDLSLVKRLLVFAMPYLGLVTFLIFLTLILTILSVAMAPRLQGLALNELVPASDFSTDEFTDALSVKNLCDALRKDGFNIQNDTVKELNRLLGQSDTIVRLDDIRKRTPEKAGIDLKNVYSVRKKSEKRIKKDNRDALQLMYPKETPEFKSAPGKFNKRQFVILALIILANLVLCLLLSIWQSYSMSKLGQRIIFDIRMKTFGHLQKMSLGFYDKQPVGRLVTRATNDVNAIGDFLSTAMVTVVNDIFMIAVLVVAMFWLDYKLAIIVLSAVIPLLIITMIFKPKLRITYRAVRKKIAQLNAYLAESLSGIKVIQAFNQEPKTYNKFSAINYEHFALSRRALIYQATFIPSVSILRGTVIALILYFGLRLSLNDVIEIGVVYTFLDYSMNFFGPIQDLADKYLMFQGAMASAERIFGILDTPVDIQDPAAPRKLIEDPIGHEIEFDNVTFSYEPDKPVLNNISFKIKRNESVAFVGVTGSGKSTIINLLCRFYDVDSGRILIDGINIRDMSQQDLRRRLGIVLQDVFLFAGTITDNIALWDKSIPPQKVKDVCEDIFASTFIEKLPNKYESRIGERGMTISGGQRQLLAFARTMAFDPSILILDEATSSVDVETEYYIQEAIKKMVKKMTSIIIAHRLSTIQNVDRIYVIHKGEIKEVGNHQQLMEKKGIYHTLCKIQTDGYLA